MAAVGVRLTPQLLSLGLALTGSSGEASDLAPQKMPDQGAAAQRACPQPLG